MQYFKGYTSGLGVSGLQSYLVSTTQRCEDLKRHVDLVWTKADGQIREVAAGQPVTVLAATMYIVSTGYMKMSNPRCDQQATFTPIVGHQYKVISYAPLGQECRLEVVDQAANSPPSDLVVESGDKCLRAFNRERELNKNSRR
jgi:hypothetical protein